MRQEAGTENIKSQESKQNEPKGKQAKDKHSWVLFRFGLLLSALRPKNQ